VPPMLVHVAWLAVAGCTVRLLLHWAFQGGPGNPALYTDLPANLLGCLVMGWAVSIAPPRRVWLRDVLPGLTRGFCGSLTTFSSWMVTTVTRALGCGDGWCWAIVVYQVFASWFACEAAFRLGVLVAHWTAGDALPHETDRVTVSSLRPVPWLPCVLLAAVMSGCVAWMAAQPSPFPASLLFAPLGACLRVALWQAGEWRGTAAANVTASLLSCVAVIMWGGTGQSGLPSATPGDDMLPPMAVLASALSFGFCGSLSTVSTLMNETHHMGTERSIAYFLATVLVTLSGCFLVLTPVYYQIRPF
jgi:CrcB protein